MMNEFFELVKMREDVGYFAERYVTAHTVDGLFPVVLNDFQKSVIECFNEGKHFNKISPRQKGKTLVAAIILLHQALFYENKSVFVVTERYDRSSHIIQIIFDIYNRLPNFIKNTALVKSNNKGGIDFYNGSSIQVFTNIIQCRGKRNQSVIVYIDESDFLENLHNILKELTIIITSSKDIIFGLTSSRSSEAFGYIIDKND